MTFKDLYIYGAGGHGQEVLRIVKRFLGSISYTICGFIDDAYTKKTYEDLPVHKVSEISEYSSIAMGIGDMISRENIFKNIITDETRFITLIDPNAILAPNAKLDSGVVLFANCIISTNVSLGKLVSVNYGATISHRSSIGDYSNICPNATICGDCTIGNKVFIGAGSIIKEKIEICDNVVIGAGAVVVKNITSPGTYVGIPAKLKEV